MAARTLKELSQIVDSRQKEIQRLKDVHEIQNLMSRWVYRHGGNLAYEFPDTLYAMKTPGVSVRRSLMVPVI